jgi:hypothetical protein
MNTKTIGRLGMMALTVAGLAYASTAHATSVKNINLVGLLREADTIVVGDVENVTNGFNEMGLPYTEVTVAVKEPLRGTVSEDNKLVFRQIGLQNEKQDPDGSRLVGPAPDGVPRYAIGENVLLFMNPAASLTGLTSTVGLGTGKFILGPASAENGLGNEGVFSDVSILSTMQNANDARILETTVGPVNTNDLLSLVRRAVNNSWVEQCLMWDTVEGKTCVQRPGRPVKTVGTSSSEGSINLNKPRANRAPRLQ